MKSGTRNLVLVLVIIAIAVIVYTRPRYEHHDIGEHAPQNRIKPKILARNTSEATQNKIDDVAHFEEHCKETLGRLARRNDLAQLHGEEIHHTPQILIESAEALGKIAQAAETNNNLKGAARSFYSDCMNDSDVVTSLRAVCLKNFRRISDELKVESSSETQSLPEEVQKLGNRIDF